MNDARQATAEVGLDREHQPLAAHREQPVLQHLACQVRLQDDLEGPSRAPVCVAALGPQLAQVRRGVVEEFAARRQLGAQLPLEGPEVGDVAREVAQERGLAGEQTAQVLRAPGQVQRIGHGDQLVAGENALHRGPVEQRARVLAQRQVRVRSVGQHQTPFDRLLLQLPDKLGVVDGLKRERPFAREGQVRTVGEGLPYAGEFQEYKRPLAEVCASGA